MRDLLAEVDQAKAALEAERKQPSPPPTPERSDYEQSGKPGEDFNRRATVDDIRAMLVGKGYREHRPNHDRQHFTRAGKKELEASGTLFLTNRVYHNFSDNDPHLKPNGSYSPFGLFAELEHGGDYSQAAGELARQGYGEPSRKSEKQAGPDNNTPHENPWAKAVIDFEQLRKTLLAERRTFLFPWLAEQSIALVYSWRGTGKSFFALGIINAVTRGEPFGPWECVEPVPCLYLDGEMPAAMLQERAEQMGIGGTGTKAPARLISMNYALDLGLPRKNLLDPEWREQLKDILIAGGYKVFFVDNIASLSPGIEENDKQAWDVINQWALELRFRGVSTVFLHHAGKSGAQRGTSGREDNVDTSILLKRPSDYEVTDGCRFVCAFEKDRCTDGRHLLAEYEMQYRDGVWTIASAKTKTRDQVLKLLDRGLSQKEVSAELGLTKGRVSQICRKARIQGVLTDENKLTQSGFCDLFGAIPGEN